MVCPKKITILVDDREKKGYGDEVRQTSFPRTILYCNIRKGIESTLIGVEAKRVSFKRRKLEGDYCLMGSEKDCMIERKGAMSEVATNVLTQDRGRQDLAFRRLIGACRVPYLFLDFPWNEVALLGRADKTEEAWSELLSLCSYYQIRIIGGGVTHGKIIRYAAGSFLARLLLTHALMQEENASWQPSLDPASQILERVRRSQRRTKNVS